jgi:hypothetical protein
MADAVRISVRTTGNPGAKVWLDRSRLPSDITPGVLNQINNTGRLRHPVFGNKKRWSSQYGGRDFWDAAVRNHQARITREVERVVDDVYTPEGGEPQHYDASTLKVSEASILQRTVDMKWQEILRGLEEDDLDAMRGIVWVIRKRGEPSLRFGDVDPGVTELTSRMSDKEIARYIEASFATGATNGKLTREMVADILRERIADVAIDPEYANRLIDRLAAQEAPKEEAAQAVAEAAEGTGSSPSPTSSTPETSTSDSSPPSCTSPQPESTA